MSSAAVNDIDALHVPPLLLVEHLSVRLQTARGAAYAVRDVSFTLRAGETLGIVGESGCGKSMMALSLLGLGPESAVLEGKVQFEGRSLIGLAEPQLAALRGNRIGFVFQEPMTALNPLHTVGKQIAETLRLHRQMDRAAARQRVIELLDRVGIANAASRIDAYPHQLSGGQRQRVTIAMALACDPVLLIADEPTTALDVTIQKQILELIASLVAERGMAMMLISHDLGVIARNVRQMMVMYGGVAIESGVTSKVLSERAHPYSQGLFAARPQLGAGRGRQLPTIAGTVPELADMPKGCPFADRCARYISACSLALPPVTQLAPAHDVRCIRANDSPVGTHISGSAEMPIGIPTGSPDVR